MRGLKIEEKGRGWSDEWTLGEGKGAGRNDGEESWKAPI